MIRLEKVSMAIKGSTILREVDLVLPFQGLIGLVGSNGAGKSTLLDVLSGFVDYSGRIVDLSTGQFLRKGELRAFTCRLHQENVVPEDLSPIQFFKVSDCPEVCSHIALKQWTEDSWEKDDRINEILALAKDLLGEKKLHSSLQELSWGQRRLVALLAVILNRKNVLLLDEPFAGLATGSAKAMVTLLRKESERRLILIIEHDLVRISELCQRVIVLASGKIVLDFPKEEFDYSKLVSYFG